MKIGIFGRIIFALAGLLGIFVAAFAPVAAAGQGFYVVRNREHKQPRLDSCFSYMEKYDCFYVDQRYNEKSAEKRVYLTFDAGYENGNVEKVLDTLKEEGVPGAFFVLEHFITANPDLVQRMVQEGHLVCNHTAKHRDMTAIHDKEAFLQELTRLEAVYRRETGKEMLKLYRPPEGRINEENLKFLQEAGYKTILWSFAYADWDNNKQPSPEKAKALISQYTHNGAILLLHPTSATNAAILGDAIRTLKKEGYSFGSVDELGRG